MDPDTSGGVTMGMDTGETTRGETEGETTDAPTTDTPATDGPSTTDGGAVCGNGMVEAGEQCDMDDLDGETCESQGFGGGALGCADDCAFDVSACTPARACGNDVIEGAEQCDGTDLGGESCQTQGFDGGTLACADDCTLDTSECTVTPACGNGAVDPGESCDGADLAGEDCVSQGFAGGGVLACAGDCTGFDTAGCMGGGGGADCCASHMGTGCQDADCEAAICGADPFCCATQWDDICANAADVNPACAGAGGTCPAGPVCGDGVVAATEVCDGANLGGEDCVSQGFAGGGVLACAGDCAGFDTAGCMMGGGGPDCCTSHMGTGCQDADCEAAICGADPFCCATQWDNICANAADVAPACVGAGGTCPAGAVCGDGVVAAPEVCDGANLDGQTCVTQGFAGGGVLACAAGCGAFDTAGCMMGGGGGCAHPLCQTGVALVNGCNACVTQICAVDAFCCNTSWDGLCVGQVTSVCGLACPGV